MRQLTHRESGRTHGKISKLPMRQLTPGGSNIKNIEVSKLPMRQLTKHDLPTA